jgi:hypothetical protein
MSRCLCNWGGVVTVVEPATCATRIP